MEETLASWIAIICDQATALSISEGYTGTPTLPRSTLAIGSRRDAARGKDRDGASHEMPGKPGEDCPEATVCRRISGMDQTECPSVAAGRPRRIEYFI